MTPTVAPEVQITFAGESRTLKYGFLAYKFLGLNPFDPSSISEFQARGLDVDLASKMICAGLLHEYYGKDAPRKGQTPPSVDDVMAELDMFNFIEIFEQIQKAIGTDKEPSAEAPKEENPPSA